MQKKLPTFQGDEVLGWQLVTQSTQLVQNKAKKNETAVGVALVLELRPPHLLDVDDLRVAPCQACP